MNRLTYKATPLALLVLLAATGCGGHRGGSDDGGTSTEATQLSFTNTSEYNGLSGEIKGTSNAEQFGSGIRIVLTNGIRTITAVVPYDSIAEGSSISADYATENVLYREQESETVYRQWAAQSGSVKITKIKDGLATVQVLDLGFKPCGCGGNTATGTFTAKGKIVDIPLATAE